MILKIVYNAPVKINLTSYIVLFVAVQDPLNIIC